MDKHFLPSSVVRTNINMNQQSAYFEKDGRTKRTKRKASPDHNPIKKVKVSGCEPQKSFEGDRHIRRIKRRLKEQEEGPTSSNSSTNQQSADLEKDGSAQRTRGEANLEQNLREDLKMPGCEPQKHFKRGRQIRRVKRRLKKHEKQLPSSLSANTDKGTLVF